MVLALEASLVNVGIGIARPLEAPIAEDMRVMFKLRPCWPLADTGTRT